MKQLSVVTEKRGRAWNPGKQKNAQGQWTEHATLARDPWTQLEFSRSKIFNLGRSFWKANAKVQPLVHCIIDNVSSV